MKNYGTPIGWNRGLNQIKSIISKKQLEESNLLLTASQESLDELEKHKAENDRLHSEVAKAKEMVKDEEEKRAKAISLLKTVRQKLSKAEKERDDAVKETLAAKENERSERVREEAEKSKHHNEIESLHAKRERALAEQKSQFERELAAVKERHEKELITVKAELELDAVTVKVCWIVIYCERAINLHLVGNSY